jgi:PKD repeat protein
LLVLFDGSKSKVGETTGFPVLGAVGVGKRKTANKIVEWNWNFGDGARAAGEKVSHTFVSPGEFVVTLHVVDDRGATGSDQMKVTVQEVPREERPEEMERIEKPGEMVPPEREKPEFVFPEEREKRVVKTTGSALVDELVEKGVLPPEAVEEIREKIEKEKRFGVAVHVAGDALLAAIEKRKGPAVGFPQPFPPTKEMIAACTPCTNVLACLACIDVLLYQDTMQP